MFARPNRRFGLGAHSKVVLRVVRNDEARVRFSLGPQTETSSGVRENPARVPDLFTLLRDDKSQSRGADGARVGGNPHSVLRVRTNSEGGRKTEMRLQ